MTNAPESKSGASPRKLLGLTLDELREVAAGNGLKPFAAKQNISVVVADREGNIAAVVPDQSVDDFIACHIPDKLL